MDDVSSSSASNKFDESGVLALLGKIMVGVVIFLALVVVFIFFLHLYTKWFLNRRRQDAASDSEGGAGRKKNAKGLDPLILETIPILAFDANEFKDGTLECTICLCEFSEGEKMRYLPKCNHGFHVDCIDMWFQSHTTCPLCRYAVSTTGESPSQTMEEASASTSALASASTELPNFPTNVLFWGNETQVSTLCNPCLDSTASTSNRSHGMLVIDIPGGINEEEESKSVMPERLRRLMRLLSGDKRVFSPSSSQSVDIEQGVRSPS